MNTFTEHELIQALRDVIEDRGPDFVYVGIDDHPMQAGYAENQCYYSEDNGKTGHCLFGCALIEKLDVNYDSGWENLGIRDVLAMVDEYQGRCDSELLDVFNNTQGAQDKGLPYEDVLETLEAGLLQIGYKEPVAA